MSNLQIFNNADFGEVRTLTIDGEPYFVGKDVAEILGYERTTKAIVDRVDEEDRNMLTSETQSQFGIELGQRGGWLINESGLYSLILSSKLPAAKKFKHWVTSEVLPAIRKHGMYAIDEFLDNPDMAIAALTALKEERAKTKALQTENAQQKQMIGELKPKADYMDKILNNKGLVTISQIAKDYGMSGRAMNEKLHELGVQYKQSGQWLLYSKYHDKGYTHSRTINITHSDGTPDVTMETKWTQKGRVFIYELLKGVGVLPVIEQTTDEDTEKITG